MANPTTNYGWQMPTPTDLVTDLPADFEVFGQSADSTVFANAALAVNKTIVDAKGDLIAATAADTVSRLPVGANNTVLTADSTAATGIKWAAAAAGGMTLINTTTASSSATITVSSIPATYKQLLIRYELIPSADGNGSNSLVFNSDTGSNYYQSAYSSAGLATVGFATNYQMYNNMDNAKAVVGTIVLQNYTSANLKIGFWNSNGYQYDDSSKLHTTYKGRTIAYQSGSAISSFTMDAVTGTFASGTVETYGIS